MKYPILLAQKIQSRLLRPLYGEGSGTQTRKPIFAPESLDSGISRGSSFGEAPGGSTQVSRSGLRGEGHQETSLQRAETVAVVALSVQT